MLRPRLFVVCHHWKEYDTHGKKNNAHSAQEGHTL